METGPKIAVTVEDQRSEKSPEMMLTCARAANTCGKSRRAQLDFLSMQANSSGERCTTTLRCSFLSLYQKSRRTCATFVYRQPYSSSREQQREQKSPHRVRG